MTTSSNYEEEQADQTCDLSSVTFLLSALFWIYVLGGWVLSGQFLSHLSSDSFNIPFVAMQIYIFSDVNRKDNLLVANPCYFIFVSIFFPGKWITEFQNN